MKTKTVRQIAEATERKKKLYMERNKKGSYHQQRPSALRVAWLRLTERERERNVYKIERL